MKVTARWPQIVFGLIIVFAFFTRVWRLGFPAGYYFDEVYHAVTAKLILHNDARAYEWTNPPPEPNTAVDWLHPPLAKLTQAAMMGIFGENSFGWRISSAVFGTGTIALVYFLAIELGFSLPIALLAMGLLSLDGLALTTSRIAMNDAHVTFFFVLTAWLYQRWKKHPTQHWTILTALAAGLAAASKWSGVFISATIILDQLRSIIANTSQRNRRISAFLSLLSAMVIIVPAIYVLSYSQMFYQGKTWSHFVNLHQQIWWYQTNLKATHPYQSTPLQWVLDWRPVYVYANFDHPNTLQNIYMLGNPLILWGGLAAAIVSAVKLAASLRKKISAKNLPARDRSIFLLIAYLLPWVPWLESPRIMFFYHYLPALPFLCLILADQLVSLYKDKRGWKFLAVGFVVATAVAFGLFFPNWTALPMPLSWAKVYFLLPSWR